MTDPADYKIRPATAGDIDQIMGLEEGSIAHPWQRKEISRLITEEKWESEANPHREAISPKE